MKKLLLGAAMALATASASHAAIDLPVPTNAYITFAGLNWAWANPLPGAAADLTYQGTQGWRAPTADELLNAPTAMNFLFAGANVSFNGTDPISGASFSATNAAYDSAASAGACASAYFSSYGYTHCDWQDGNGQTFGPWAGTAGAASFADQLYVREAGGGVVPEPATWALMISGFGLAGATLRRRRMAVAAI